MIKAVSSEFGINYTVAHNLTIIQPIDNYTCMTYNVYMETKNGATRDTVYEYAENEYGSLPEHLWTTFPLYSVFRRADNKKWYAIVMNIQGRKLGLDSDEYVDIVDVKCDPFEKDELLCKPGFLPAYHLSRKTWITVLLDGTVDSDTLFDLIDKSYLLASGRKNGVKS